MDITRARYIKKWISELPQGNITYKTIKGKKYPYYQWSENGKQYGRAVKEYEIDELSEKINQRMVLKEEYDIIYNKYPEALTDEYYFSTVMFGDNLLEFIEPVKDYKKRFCYDKLHDYIYGRNDDKVFILYGLRRTGKTTLMRQLIAEMDEETFSKTAFLKVDSNIDLAKINIDLKVLQKNGFKYVFIDEVTMMNDFIDSAALFSDVYASCGMKIILSGTDSLGFMLSVSDELYDRAHMLHTTFIPYSEFESVLGIKSIDEYIRYGGTMSLGGVNYNSSHIFNDEKELNKYVDSAIARNIQNSLKNCSEGKYFRNLIELYEANELTNVINRVVEDINHRFTLDVLTKDFVSNDLSISAKNLIKDRNEPNDILYNVNTKEITDKLKELLEIRNKNELLIPINETHRKEIKEYLDLLDITVDIDVVSITDFNKKNKKTVISQPGIRFSQAQSLIKSLMEDNVFRVLSRQDKTFVIERILSDIKGRMMEDIILLETKKANKNSEVFKLIFANGEIDMVVFDTVNNNCSLYEIKHSKVIESKQYRHLIDKDKCKEIEFYYGNIISKNVIYRGESTKQEEVNYLNVEEYLNNLNK